MDAPDDLIREILDRAGVVWMQEDDPELPAMPSDDAFNVERVNTYPIGLRAMPKGPKGQKRPADVIANAVRVMRIATGEISEETDSRNQAAVSLGKLGGKKGGNARAAKLTAQERRRIAAKGAEARWKSKT